ncbi:hypothetical protein [Nonomuraea sp. NPDC050783]|uniref:hypothetical protein n=1 Tax=Nonomuraea sp. NPDC050783 TaxID=3154634 RepID=UPI0034668393
MVTRRILAVVVAALLAGSTLAATGPAEPASAVAAPIAAPVAAAPVAAVAAAGRARCKYRVRHVRTRLNVRAAPGGRIRDKLYPGDVTWGSCRKFGQWRRVRGVDADRRGFAFARYLRKVGRR